MGAFRTTAHRAGGLVVPGLTAAVLLAATACGAGEDRADGTPPPGPSASASSTPSGSSGSRTALGAPGDGEPVPYDGTCGDANANTEVTMDFALSPEEDDAKYLLVATNTGDQPCTLYDYPVITFGDAGYVLPVLKNSEPRTPVQLAPGQKAYAGLLARQSNKENSSPETTIVLGPPGRKTAVGGTDEGALIEPPREEGVYVDRMARVTFWQSDARSAVSPLFAH
ncbi:DUF4232 domain-containing protein [Streptomyces sp. NPDC002308]